MGWSCLSTPGPCGRAPCRLRGLVLTRASPVWLQIITTLTTNSSSKTSRTQTRYLSKRPVTLARCRSPWGSRDLRFLAVLSSCRSAAVPRLRASRQTRRPLCPRRSGGARPRRPRTARAAGCPMSGTPRSMTTSRRTTCRTRPLASPPPTRPSLLSSPSRKGLPRLLLNLWVISLLPNLRVTQRSHRLYQRRKTNTVSLCGAAAAGVRVTRRGGRWP